MKKNYPFSLFFYFSFSLWINTLAIRKKIEMFVKCLTQLLLNYLLLCLAKTFLYIAVTDV